MEDPAHLHRCAESTLEQAALVEFLKTRKFDRHIQKMRKIYSLRREVLMESLKDTFGGAWSSCGDAAGLHVAIDFPERRFDDGFQAKCLQNGLYITPMENHCIKKGRHQSQLLFGYGHLDPEEIKRGVVLLSNIMGGF